MALPSIEEVQAEAEEFVATYWDPDMTVRAWWAALARAGYSSPTLQVDLGGRGWPRSLAAAANAVFARHQLVAAPGGLGMMLAVPTIASQGSAEVQRRFLPGILDGTEAWCQLFSEPGAGSDLAGLQTRAERDGDEWVITGQKVWTSTGQVAQWGMLVARTDPDQPKHKGLTYFAFPMQQRGVEVRPLTEMTGRALFNEVFIDGARVSNDNIIGALGDGWRVANATLTAERAGIGGGGGGSFSAASPGTIAGHLDRPVREFVGRRGAIAAGNVSQRSVRTLIELATERGLIDEADIRQGIARLHTLVQISSMANGRMRAGSKPTGGEGNLGKIRMTEMLHLARHLIGRVLGPDAQLWGPDVATGGSSQELIVFSPAPSIYGGTDEIQRNIIGERVLGLPREPGPSKDTPFRELLHNSN